MEFGMLGISVHTSLIGYTNNILPGG